MTPKKKRPKTDNRGAADERACIKAIVIRLGRASIILPNANEYARGVRETCAAIVKSIDSRSKRFKARKGGL